MLVIAFWRISLKVIFTLGQRVNDSSAMSGEYRQTGRPSSASFSLDEFDVIDFDDQRSSIESNSFNAIGNATLLSEFVENDKGEEGTLVGTSDGGGMERVPSGDQYPADKNGRDKLCNCCEAFERFLVS